MTDLDLSYVAPQHEAVHAELTNWAAWCATGRRALISCAPMFRHYRTPAGYRELRPTSAIDSLAAIATQQRFTSLPEKHRWAIGWAYCYPWVSVGKVQRELGATKAALAELIRDGRTMLDKRETVGHIMAQT